MGTIIIIIIIVVVVVIAIVYSMVTKSNREKEIEVTKHDVSENVTSEEFKKDTSYKNEYVELADIVPITGKRADGPMDTFTTSIAGIGRYCNQTDIGYIIGRVLPEPDSDYNPNAMASFAFSYSVLALPLS